MNNVVFHIDKENKVVVAVLKCDPYELYNIVSKAVCKFEDNRTHSGMMCCASYNCPEISSEYVGIARCSKNDEFDEEFGKRLALARAKAKKADAIQKKFFKLVDWLDNFTYYIGKKYDSLYRNWVELSADKDKLLKQVDPNF